MGNQLEKFFIVTKVNDSYEKEHEDDSYPLQEDGWVYEILNDNGSVLEFRDPIYQSWYKFEVDKKHFEYRSITQEEYDELFHVGEEG